MRLSWRFEAMDWNTREEKVRIALNTQILVGGVLGLGLGLLFARLGPEASGVKQGIYLCSLVGGLFMPT